MGEAILKQCLTAALLAFALATSAMAQDSRTFRVTLPGTGTPNPNPDRFGPSTPQEAGEVFSEARPKMTAFTHFVLLANKDYPPMTPSGIEAATRETYDGPLAMGEDLMAFDLSGDAARIIPWNSDK